MSENSGTAGKTASDFSFAVGGMTCASCVRFVEKSLSAVPGVEYVSVNLTDGKAYAVTDGRPGWEDLAAAVSGAGYEPLEEVPDEEETERRFRRAGARVFVSWAVALPAMALMVLHMSGVHVPYLPWLEAAAGMGVILGPGRFILKGAWIALTHRHANMDVLVALGAVAAWVTALLAIADLPIRSFGALSPMIPAFHLTGRYVEEKLRRRAGADLRALMSVGSGTATVIEEDGSPVELPVDAVKEGARLRIRTGERIPLDGRIASGEGSVGEAMVTGESVPVLKSAGDEVIGGTVLEKGLLEIEVTRTGEDAFLAKMLALVEQAQGAKVPLQALADRVAGIFVPLVFLLAMASAALWVAFYPSLSPLLERAAAHLPWIPSGAGPWTTGAFAFVSLLVVACPCALGLATPMALSVGSGLAARRGLLIKGGEALQYAGDLDVILFDKTGTLTAGRPTVRASDLPEEDIRGAAALEALSVHPLARAVTEWAESEGLAPSEGSAVAEDVEEVAGEGISGTIGGIRYFVGRPGTGRKGPGAPETFAEASPGDTVVEVLKDGAHAGFLAIADPLKPDSAAAVGTLLEKGIRPVMVTGDAPGAAAAVAGAVGIPPGDVRSGLLPEDKLRAVQEFQSKGLRVGMAGDGINDAAALKAADVGFALAEGTDLSMESGDIVITRGGLDKIAEAIALSKLMVGTIKGNLFWAFGYNTVALPAAAAALVHPLMAETAMSLSSIGVVLNSLAIRRRHRRADAGGRERSHSEGEPGSMPTGSIETNGIKKDKEKTMKTYEIDVKGMSCGHCTSRVEGALMPLAKEVTVSLEEKKATVVTSQAPEALLSALEEAGYPGSLRG